MSEAAGTDVVVIVSAVGASDQLSHDAALFELGEGTVIEQIVANCRAAGIDRVMVARSEDAAPLPEGLDVDVTRVGTAVEVSDILRLVLLKLPRDATVVMVFPVAQALVQVDTLLALCASLSVDGCSIAMPTYRDKPGHPVAMHRAVFKELDQAGKTLGDVIGRDPSRVAVIPTANHWVCTDLDQPEDLRAARCALSGEPWSTLAQMYRHRSHRAYLPDALPDAQIERLVDAARHASTSSFIQAYSVIAVRDAELKGECARLCGGQHHIEAAPVFFAICADLHKIARACVDHGVAVRVDSFELFLQATVDAALLGQNLQLACEAEGLGACMIGGARNHPIELSQALQLPKPSFVVFGMTAGLASDNPTPRGRMPLSGVLHWNRYDTSDVGAVLRGADERMRDWAKRCNVEEGGYNGRPVNEQKGWADRMAKMWGGDSAYAESRKVLVEELRELGFEL